MQEKNCLSKKMKKIYLHIKSLDKLKQEKAKKEYLNINKEHNLCNLKRVYVKNSQKVYNTSNNINSFKNIYLYNNRPLLESQQINTLPLFNFSQTINVNCQNNYKINKKNCCSYKNIFNEGKIKFMLLSSQKSQTNKNKPSFILDKVLKNNKVSNKFRYSTIDLFQKKIKNNKQNNNLEIKEKEKDLSNNIFKSNSVNTNKKIFINNENDKKKLLTHYSFKKLQYKVRKYFSFSKEARINSLSSVNSIPKLKCTSSYYDISSIITCFNQSLNRLRNDSWKMPKIRIQNIKNNSLKYDLKKDTKILYMIHKYSEIGQKIHKENPKDICLIKNDSKEKKSNIKENKYKESIKNIKEYNYKIIMCNKQKNKDESKKIITETKKVTNSYSQTDSEIYNNSLERSSIITHKYE